MLPSLNPIPSFPAFDGPYKVGSTEIEIPTSEIPSTSPVPDPKIKSIKFRAFYPTKEAATSKKPVSWLPEPHKESMAGLISFTGASPRIQKLLNLFPNILSYVNIPAIRDAPLLSQSSKYPVVIFSHGLGGNANAYSSLCGNLASCGIVVFAPEHRDGSCPVAYAKTKRSNSVSSAYKIPYQKHPHRPDPEILASRNKQLRVRLWELELLYSAINALNEGKSMDTFSLSSPPTFTGTLDLTPGKVTWAGHSFGGATIVQFIKSVFYHASLPAIPSPADTTDNMDWTPLYTPSTNHILTSQITARTPLILLDLWTMPLRGPLTEWLWQLPLPCYTLPEHEKLPLPVLGIMSTEFTGYAELLTRMKALLSADPVDALDKLLLLDEQRDADDAASSQSHDPATSDVSPSGLTLSRSTSDQASTMSTTPSNSDSTSTSNSDSISTSSTLTPLSSCPLLFTVPHSAHLSQSDFGPLFPYLNRRFLKVDDPHAKIRVNVRAMLQTLRVNGIAVWGGVGTGGDKVDGTTRDNELKEKDGWDEEILVGDGKEGLVRVALDS